MYNKSIQHSKVAEEYEKTSGLWTHALLTSTAGTTPESGKLSCCNHLRQGQPRQMQDPYLLSLGVEGG